MKGNTGVSFNDRQLAGQVRSMALDHLKEILNPDFEDKEYQKQMLLKIASNLLPRLNEHTGEDGAELKIVFDNAFTPTSKEDSTK